ncbi:MAG: glycosyltransferase [Bacteroidia bacterium]|nr:glycosyltransferase [Bacteroidia bacterium]HMX97735.1 glycosyltransferase [Bacteroidia bacterium]HMY64442.1 glycosyltransferase [Bacteroidia bacterium]HNF31759.1 glycosyltransferase [Bacteroidia bacterium]HNI30891.1 glycosyltransferase [Bacteroidia bacterium]
MIYLTYADQPSGVYSSQVVDVCNFLNESHNAQIRLVSFISLHNFSHNRQKIKREMPSAIVLPMLPRMTSFGFNTLMLFFVLLFLNQRSVIARNVLAARIALRLRSFLKLKVCFDGRGAIAAEWNEYQVVPLQEWKNSIHTWEKSVVLNVDFRIAVSEELVKYWNERYGYSENKHVVIPCTLNTSFRPEILKQEEIENARKKMKFDADDIVLVYSGSTAGWQSFDLLQGFLQKIINNNKNIKVLFLSEKDKNVDQLKAEFPDKIFQTFVKHSEVSGILKSCDIGILIREKSVTNQVASPTKFAEYLSAGLPVIISEGIGDYTSFVKQNDCGWVLDESPLQMNRLNISERNRLLQLVNDHFTKKSHNASYTNLIQLMT